jgi:hypothetical protein
VDSAAHRVLKCERPDESYTGTLICARNDEDFRIIRNRFLDTAIDPPQDVTALPAGRDQEWDFQVSFSRKNRGAARVLWHDADPRCLAEMQLDETDLEVALGYVSSGSG